MFCVEKCYSLWWTKSLDKSRLHPCCHTSVASKLAPHFRMTLIIRSFNRELIWKARECTGHKKDIPNVLPVCRCTTGWRGPTTTRILTRRWGICWEESSPCTRSTCCWRSSAPTRRSRSTNPEVGPAFFTPEVVGVSTPGWIGIRLGEQTNRNWNMRHVNLSQFGMNANSWPKKVDTSTWIFSANQKLSSLFFRSAFSVTNKASYQRMHRIRSFIGLSGLIHWKRESVSLVEVENWISTAQEDVGSDAWFSDNCTVFWWVMKSPRWGFSQCFSCYIAGW